MNFFGFCIGLITLVVIGMGFVWVIRGERYLGHLWWPYFMGAGILMIVISLFISNPWGSAILGVIGGHSSGVQQNSRNRQCARNWAGIPLMQKNYALHSRASSKNGRHLIYKNNKPAF